MHCCLVCFPFLCWVKLCGGCFRQAFFGGGGERGEGETKKVVAGYVRLVVVLYSNNFMGVCLGALSIAPFRQVVVL